MALKFNVGNKGTKRTKLARNMGTNAMFREQPNKKKMKSGKKETQAKF